MRITAYVVIKPVTVYQTGQTRYAKDSGPCIIWKCPQHGSGIAEVIIPPAPIYEQPNRPSAMENLAPFA